MVSPVVAAAERSSEGAAPPVQRGAQRAVGVWGLLLGLGACTALDPKSSPSHSESGSTASPSADSGGQGGGSGGEGGEPEQVDSGVPDDTGDSGDPGDTAPPCDRFLSPAVASGGDGSAARPWPSLAEASALGLLSGAGEVVCLLPGDHGAPRLAGLVASPALLLRAEPRREAVVTSLVLEGVQGVTIEGLTIDATATVDTEIDHRPQFLVLGDAETTGVTLRDVLVQTEDSSGAWTRQDWDDRPFSGVDLRGPDNHVEDSLVRNIYHGISMRGDHSSVVRTVVDNFGGDGLRGLGSGSRYEWNIVRDAYIDDYAVNHDDAFQAYRLDGEDLRIADVVIRHNQFLLFADPITDFVRDEGLVVFASDAGPWVRISDQTKTGHANVDNVIRNNLATMLTPWDYDESSLVEGNLEIDDPALVFHAPAALDFTLAEDSPAIDAGVASDLVEVDLNGAPRLQGDGVDIGAFERR